MSKLFVPLKAISKALLALLFIPVAMVADIFSAFELIDDDQGSRTGQLFNIAFENIEVLTNPNDSYRS